MAQRPAGGRAQRGVRWPLSSSSADPSAPHTRSPLAATRPKSTTWWQTPEAPLCISSSDNAKIGSVTIIPQDIPFLVLYDLAPILGTRRPRALPVAAFEGCVQAGDAVGVAHSSKMRRRSAEREQMALLERDGGIVRRAGGCGRMAQRVRAKQPAKTTRSDLHRMSSPRG